MYKSKLYDYIFVLWRDCNMSYREIASMWMPNMLSFKRIRNIVYGGQGRLKSENEKEVYKLFREKFLEFQDVDCAINWVYEHQPYVKAPCETRIRSIIRMQLRERRSKSRIKFK